MNVVHTTYTDTPYVLVYVFISRRRFSISHIFCVCIVKKFLYQLLIGFKDYFINVLTN